LSVKEGNASENKTVQEPKWLQDLLDGFSQNPEVAGLIASLGAIAAGAAMLLDDAKDFGKDGTERDPPMPHHWLWGALTLIGGVAGACTSSLTLLKKLSPPQKPVEMLPESFLKQSVPVEKVQEKLRIK
jgi:hypothetical protein